MFQVGDLVEAIRNFNIGSPREVSIGDQLMVALLDISDASLFYASVGGAVWPYPNDVFILVAAAQALPMNAPNPILVLRNMFDSPDSVIVQSKSCRIVKSSALNKEFLYCKEHDEEADHSSRCRKVK